MYGKIHTEIFDSSLIAEGGWLANYIFICMVTLSDSEGYLRHDPRTLYRRIGFNVDDRVSYGEFSDSIEFLESPDEKSNLPAQKGRRIIPLSELPDIEGDRGWFVVNKVHYRDKGGSIEQRRAKTAQRVRRYRERKNNDLASITPECNVTVTRGNACNAYTDTDTDTDKRKDIDQRNVTVTLQGFDEFWQAYPKKRGKKRSREIWQRKKLHTIGVDIVQDVLNRTDSDQRWIDGFIPDPATYLNGERWEDEFTDTKGVKRKTTYAEQLAADMKRMGMEVGDAD